jgi:predicted DCC family thiol-disulfide oxidoreductase YuxK
MAKSTSKPVLFTVFYDAGCSIFRTRIAIYKMEARRADLAIEWRDVSAAPGALAEFGIDAEGARRRLHVLDPDGTLLAGADAFALLWSALPGYRRLGRLVASPAFNAIAHAIHDSGRAHALRRARRGFRATRGGAAEAGGAGT